MRIHPSEYLLDEMVARHWSRDQLATAMTEPGDPVAWHVNRLAIDMYIDVGPTNTGIRLGRLAQQFARALGTSEDVWTHLERAWLESLPETE